jgi:hypothetical protein
MVRKMFLLVMLGTFLAIGGFWALRAQDPAPQQTPKTPTTTTQTEQKTTMPKTTQLDLSGTYAGSFTNCDALGLTGDQTLTITGNQFTTADGKTGRIIASKTRGYTAVAMQMSGANSPVVSFRGKKSGTKLTLSPVSGGTSQCTFATSKSRGTATGTTVGNPSTTTPTTTTPTTTTPTTTTPTTTMPSQSPSPSPSASPTPSPEPNPEPAPSPSGSPRPGPSPSPSEPMPSPTPSPSPSPRP